MVNGKKYWFIKKINPCTLTGGGGGKWQWQLHAQFAINASYRNISKNHTVLPAWLQSGQDMQVAHQFD